MALHHVAKLGRQGVWSVWVWCGKFWHEGYPYLTLCVHGCQWMSAGVLGCQIIAHTIVINNWNYMNQAVIKTKFG